MVDAGSLDEDAAHVAAGTERVAIRADDVAKGIWLAAKVVVKRKKCTLTLLVQRLDDGSKVLINRVWVCQSLGREEWRLIDDACAGRNRCLRNEALALPRDILKIVQRRFRHGGGVEKK